MSRIFILLAIALLSFWQNPAAAGESDISTCFPSDFKERAFRHVVRLAEFGPRSPGGEGERPAFAYICEQLEQAGLDVRVEAFDYETFDIERIDFTVCGKSIEVETIGFNPYAERRDFGGKAVLIDPDVTSEALNRMDLGDAIVLTTSPVDYFQLFVHNPRLIIYVRDSDFATLMREDCLMCRLKVEGKLETRSSANIVADLPDRDLNDSVAIISAHWDSYRDSPGADDDGSGVGVLLELARYFASYDGDIGGTIEFVSFGAEELGIVGSRAYLEAHRHDLRNCVLVFNMDNVGGPQGPVIETLGGVQGIPERTGTSQFPERIRDRTLEGLDGRWRIIDTGLTEAFATTNRPEWLVTAIESSAEELGTEFRAAGNLGADQQVFTQAGIVATGIGSSGNRHHGPDDVPSQIDKDMLEIAGKMVAGVAIRSLNRSERR